MLYIQTLSWKGADKLLKLKESIMPALDGLDFKWVIKNNGPGDNTVDLINSWNDSRIEVIDYPNNIQNFSEGMNYIFDYIKHKDEDYVLLLNNDVICNDIKSIKNMISIMERDNSVGIVGAKLLYTNTSQIQHVGVVWSTHGPYHYRSKEVVDDHSNKDREFQAITAAVMLTKAKYYKNVCTTNKSGRIGLDEAYGWSYEDVDFNLHVSNIQKKKIVYCGRTNFYHEESASLKKNPMNKMFMNQNSNRLREKWKNFVKIDNQNYINNPKHKLYVTPKK